MEIGKLSNEQLEKIVFSKIKYKHPKVLVGSAVGEDCSIIDFDNELCVISTDPITATTKNIGKLAVNVSCNDVAAKGVQPFAIMVTILAPPSVELEEIQQVMNDIIENANMNFIEIIGGHTEVTDAVNRTLVSITSIGKGKPTKLLLGEEKILPGDLLIMSKHAAWEGTGILYNDFKEQLDGILDANDKKEIEYIEDNLSVIDEGVTASLSGVKMMHDVTEGGILGAAWEISEKAGMGIRINMDKIPLLQSTRKITEFFNINPYKLISSGVMMMVVSPDKIDVLSEKLDNKGIKISVIGIFQKEDSVIVNENKTFSLLMPPYSDELYKAYS